jgi:Cu2+-exporting ATPase
MKTSIINVHDMLSVLSVDEVEKRIGEVPGVESVTVNFAAENATVRYDETRLEATDIKSAVRQKSYESDKPEQSEVKPIEDKTEAPATPPVVKSQEEKDKTETMPPENKEKVEEHAGHKMDEMSKDKAEDSNEPPPTTKADKL